jgi:hypothetical protein
MVGKKKKNLVYRCKASTPNKYDTSTCKKTYGESLKYAWVRLNVMHDNDPNLISDAKLNLTYYFGWEA